MFSKRDLRSMIDENKKEKKSVVKSMYLLQASREVKVTV